MFSASERALAVSLYAAAPFAGPVIGVSSLTFSWLDLGKLTVVKLRQPIVGGFVIMNTSWHWIFWILVIVSWHAL